ncbi:MAG: hypothetical protein R3A80_09555 [Bdellovibrionota bacterium]
MRTFTVWTLFFFLFSLQAYAVSDNNTLLKRIKFFSQTEESSGTPSYRFTGKGVEECSVSQNTVIKNLNENMINNFFDTQGKYSSLRRRAPKGADLAQLHTLAEAKNIPKLRDDSSIARGRCDQAIEALKDYTDALLSFHSEGYVVPVNSSVLALIKPRLHKLGESLTLVSFLSNALITYMSIENANPGFDASSSLGIFLVAQTYDLNDKLLPGAQLNAVLKLIPLSFRRYNDILLEATNSSSYGRPSFRLDDFLNSYICLGYTEAASKDMLARGKALDAQAYVRTLVALNAMFPGVEKETSSRSIFDEIYAGEAIARTVEEEKLGDRAWLMNLIPALGNENSLHTAQYKAQLELVSTELKTYLWKERDRELTELDETQSRYPKEIKRFDTTKARLLFAAHMLRLTSEIFSIEKAQGYALSQTQVKSIRAEIKTRYDNFHDIKIVSASLPKTKKQGI